jgi:hypothetical protein
VQLLAKAAARGGNTLMNVGPMGDGRIDPKDVEILQGIGAWWRVNGESIRGTTCSPLPVQTWGESTAKGSTLYLHVFEWPKDGRLVVGGLKSKVRAPRLLAESEGTIAYKLSVKALNASDVVITGLPRSARDKADSVIALEVVGDVEVDATRLLQPAFASEALRVFDSELHGKGIKFGAGKTRDAYACEWTKTDQFITWSTRLNEAATYEVELTYDAEAGSSNGGFAVSFGGESLKGVVKPGVMQVAALGRVTLKPGSHEIKLFAVDLKGDEMMKPRALTLKPIAR